MTSTQEICGEELAAARRAAGECTYPICPCLEEFGHCGGEPSAEPRTVDDCTMIHCPKCGGQVIFGKCACDPVIIPDMATVELDALARLGGSLMVDQGAAEIFDELRKIALAYISRTRQVEDMMNFILATYIVNVKARAKEGDEWCAKMDAWVMPQLEQLKALRTTVVTESVI
jgi:hypothetical protein